jgi:hypothetical protein
MLEINGGHIYLGKAKPAGGGTITVDDALSLSSENPVQNKVITAALNDKQDKLDGTVYTTDNLIAGTNISITQVPAPIIDEYTKALWNFEAGTDDVIAGYTHTTIRVAGKDPVAPERSSSLYRFGEYSLHNSGYNYCAWNFTSALQSNGEFTLDFWLKTSAPSSYGYWPEIRIDTAPSGGGWGQEILKISSDGSVFKVGNSYIDLKSVCPFPEDTNWHHIAITFATSTGNAKFFLDGIHKCSIEGTEFTINLTNMQAYLVLYDSQGWYFDEIRFSNCIRWTSNFTPWDEPYTQGGNAVYQINNTQTPSLTWYSGIRGNSLTIADTSAAKLVKIYKNGILLQPSADYTISGTTLTMDVSLVETDKIALEVI